MVLGVDVGGTFTDAALITPVGLFTGKAPSTADDQSIGVMAAVRGALGAADARPEDVERLVHGMTVGTNALLEGNTARTALVATEGFTDLEELGRQARPDLYRLCARGPEPIVPAERRVAAPERQGPDGLLRELDVAELERRLSELPSDVEAVAVCLLWGFRHPEHERVVAETVRRYAPGVHVSTSHDTACVFREYERLVTTVTDAALSPLLRSYLERVIERAREAALPQPEVMLSSGGVVSVEIAAEHGSWTVLSGPAGGAVAAARAAERAGVADAVGFDMGGTSCDVSLVVGGRVAVTGGREVAGRALALPMVDVHTVGAGGGSVAWRDSGGALRVGPRSAGADPGPACYGKGGTEPTVTDANLVLGLLSASAPLSGGVALNERAAHDAIGALAGDLALGPQETASGILRVANAEMARAVRVVTVEQGLDPREMALVAFGGAGPLHAASVAEELGMRRVVVPVVSGVLSALGLAISERRRDLAESVLLAGPQITRETIGAVVRRLASSAREDIGSPDAEVRATYDLRYAGQAFELPVDGETEPDPAELRRAFDSAHAQRFGYEDSDAELELVTVRVAVALAGAGLPEAEAGAAGDPGQRLVRFGERWRETAVYGPGEARVRGPAILELEGSTISVPPGWSGRAGAEAVVIER
ncbi:MAG: hydantoinase/oxoprolinase family protein [Thermoleophilaceae bacterium]